MSPRPLYIFGGGGQAREVAEVALRLGYAPSFVVVDAVEHPEDWPVVMEGDLDVRSDLAFAIGIGDNEIRARVAGHYPHAAFPNLIHPDATVESTTARGLAGRRGVVIQAGVRLTANVEIGDFCNLNLNATVSHDTRLGSFVTVSPGASIAGHVAVGEKAWIGVGAVISNGTPGRPVRIGARAVVGAGAVVIRDCDEDGVYAGVPARRLK